MKRLILSFLIATAAWAQLSMQQRVDDFNYLSGVLNRNYAAYEWKQKVLGFDLLETRPWLEKVRAAKDDFEYYDICIAYVASLSDANTYVQLPSDFVADLGFTADLYDGKAIIDLIDRQKLPLSKYDLALGDELVSMDGIPVERLIQEYGKYGIESNKRSTDRFAVDFLTYRQQAYVTRAADVGATARVAIRKADGTTETLDLPWTKTGTPMQVGPVPDFTAESKSEPVLDSLDRAAQPRFRTARNLAAAADADPVEVSATGALAPLFTLPADFQRRLGTGRTDQISSGSYLSAGKRIGYLRIPSATASTAFLNQLDGELVWLSANTDVLVLDQMRDRITNICASERVAARFVGRSFTQPGFAYRGTLANVRLYEDALDNATAAGAPDATIGILGDILRALRQAYAENRGMTGALPVCGTSLTDRPVTTVSYTKPILLVVDEFSSDLVPAILQDEGRAKVFGMRTRGTLGLSLAVRGSAFGETVIFVKDALMVRSKSVKNPGYPDGPYVESSGVHPEVVEDFMTIDNYKRKGVGFVEAFTKSALDLISDPRP